MAIVSQPGRVQEGVVAQPRITQQVFPLDYLDHAPKLAAKLLNPATAIGSGAPAIGVNFQLAHDVRHDIAVKDAIISYSDGSVAKIGGSQR